MVLEQGVNRIAGALALALIAAPAHSDPLGRTVSHRNIARIVDTFTLQQVAYRVCKTQGSERRCHWVDIHGPGLYGYGAPSARYRYGPAGDYIPSDPSDYRAGTLRWWGSLDRLNRGGNGNGP